MTFVPVNISISTLLGFNLLVAIRANCKQTTQIFSHFVILDIAYSPADRGTKKHVYLPYRGATHFGFTLFL